MYFLALLAVIMRGHRTVIERSEYSMTVLSAGSARVGLKVTEISMFFSRLSIKLHGTYALPTNYVLK